MCTKYLQERKELVQALHKDIKLSDLPKITQPMLTIWGNQDQIFPLELAHRLKRLMLDSFSLNHVPFIFSTIWVRTHTSDHKECRSCNQCREVARDVQTFEVIPCRFFLLNSKAMATTARQTKGFRIKGNSNQELC
ncbi:hypothetical protein LOK49_LG05G01416 [Camellia lanceoleosa]|uniref:Uncharacterized protein n=1 Tax=Camellia lanceoleosa TaxID=1840588 RepID=A0ACC0HK60_9ERIC|nr:hypothetical protein LOK49_LG05G01416 [Camellia lanceoleosa]